MGAKPVFLHRAQQPRVIMDKFENRVNFILKLGRALHTFGTPVHHLESTMTGVAKTLGLSAQFFCTTTAIFAAIDVKGSQQNHMLRIQPGDLNLEKLCLVDEITLEVLSGNLSPGLGSRRLAAVEKQAPRYRSWVTALCFAITAAATARIFGGGLQEIAAGLATGMGIGLLVFMAGKFEAVGRLFPVLAGIIAAFLANAMQVWLPGVTGHIAVIAGLIVLVPGMSITVAMIELATQHLVSGTTRLMSAFSFFLQLGFGVVIGTYAAGGIWGTMPVETLVALPGWSLWLALAVTPFCLTILFQARPRDAFWAVISAFLAYFSARYGSLLWGPALGALTGALAVGVAGNLFARLADRPAAVMTLPGMILLVPGSLGFRSVSALVQKNVVQGMETGFEMVLIAVALVTGLLLASLLLPPRKAL